MFANLMYNTYIGGNDECLDKKSKRAVTAIIGFTSS